MSQSCCPLCHFENCEAYHKDKHRAYLQCQRCQLVFVDSNYLLSADDEKQIYDLHQNQHNDPGYQRFLSRLSNQITKTVPIPASGLDFGCGPAPVLATLLTNAGYQMCTYDPFYPGDPEALNQTYDFISCSEAIEHFHQPRREWHTWLELLKPDGWLCIMTKRVINRERFATWHYKNDLTHVCFFSEETFDWLANTYHFDVFYPENDVVLMHRKQTT